MTTIQNKQQNLKSQIKPKEPEDLKRELKGGARETSQCPPIFRRSQRRIEG
jgi:hypothetical protein